MQLGDLMAIEIGNLFHRSRDRIKFLGEVFTPESYVEDMLDLISRDKRGFWSDEDIVFFEPSCGHGNIVAPIFKKRIEALYKKAQASGIKDSAFYALANAINTMWAIDIDSKNINHCRSRVLIIALEFLKDKYNTDDSHYILKKNQEFIAHFLCAINWHICENETLSSLSCADMAINNARQTKSGSKWYSQNGHSPINFEDTWVSNYNSCLKQKTIPLKYERSIKFLKNSLAGLAKGFEEFEFAKLVIFQRDINQNTTKNNPDLAAGA